MTPKTKSAAPDPITFEDHGPACRRGEERTGQRTVPMLVRHRGRSEHEREHTGHRARVDEVPDVLERLDRGRGRPACSAPTATTSVATAPSVTSPTAPRSSPIHRRVVRTLATSTRIRRATRAPPAAAGSAASSVAVCPKSSPFHLR